MLKNDRSEISMEEIRQIQEEESQETPAEEVQGAGAVAAELWEY